jgi:choline dehydrogenase
VRDRYDYIVIGAGSAGCAVAAGLSVDPRNQVLLVESGPEDKNPFIHMPRGFGVILNPGSKVIWEYDVKTGTNQQDERWIRGKTLGGSSSVNGMVYMRGAPLDYDGWEAQGCTGWGWDKVERTFVSMENHDLGAGASRGAGGPLNLTTHPRGDRLFDDIITAGEEMGIARVPDVNDPEAVREGGLGYQPTTRWRGARFSAARAFLTEARKRSNLDIVTDSDVLKIEFEGQRATAIRLRDAQGVRTIRADREIVISAGAFQTPKLLQLSGIGDAKLLTALGIEVQVDSPDVGQNLREHRHTDLWLKVTGNSQNKSLSGYNAILSALRYFIFKGGPMSHAAHEIGGFAKSTDDLDHADLQFGLMSMSASQLDKAGKLGVDPFPGITLVTYFTRPESQGEVRVQSADPDAPLYVNANHLSAEIDRRKFVAAVRWNRRLAAQPALARWVVDEVKPGRAIETDEDILANAMSISGSCFHMAGTARMGADDRAVCDPRLRVRGVQGLRVADTSIFPTLVSGNTNAPAMMTGMRAAQFIIEDNPH